MRGCLLPNSQSPRKRIRLIMHHTEPFMCNWFGGGGHVCSIVVATFKCDIGVQSMEFGMRDCGGDLVA